ncbi:MAG: acyl-ACP--UDP-N-acetylglucosamine O-acyltransferase [Gammaproteobacteria bacterium]|nr:acyl-ACP--UDP-N-acetylglucosamine O-acyltransferase [Gammaproteobacteria bacterium]
MIDPKAVIDSQAEIDEGVSIGPFSVIGPNVRIGRGTDIRSHVVINGHTTIGVDNKIFQFASIGEDPQDMKYAGEETFLEIGDRNTIREFTTINRGTTQDTRVTRLGSDNLLMAYAHMAHDCQVGNHTILANAASLAGHVHVDDWAILGGFCCVHQYCHIGAHSFNGLGSTIKRDVPPYVLTDGNPAKPYGINSEGLRRRGFSDESIRQIKAAYKIIYKKKMKLDDVLAAIQELAQICPEVGIMAEFIANSERSIVR